MDAKLEKDKGDGRDPDGRLRLEWWTRWVVYGRRGLVWYVGTGEYARRKTYNIA